MDAKNRRSHCTTVWLLLLALAQTACAQTTPPADVTAFIEQRDVCDHLRGELPDPEEQEQLESVVNDINRHCKGTDTRLQELKKKYTDNVPLLQVLDHYEMNIEAP